MTPFGGVRVIFTPYALEQTTERLFPKSKNRSKRIHKKLVKRFGGEFRMKPCIWQANGTIFAHPIYRSQIEAAASPLPIGGAR